MYQAAPKAVHVVEAIPEADLGLGNYPSVNIGDELREVGSVYLLRQGMCGRIQGILRKAFFGRRDIGEPLESEALKKPPRLWNVSYRQLAD